MVTVEDFIQHMLNKLNSSLVERTAGVATIQLQRFESDGADNKHLTSTSLFVVHDDGRVLVKQRDDVEGTDFRERNRYLLKNVTLEMPNKQRIHKLGW